MNLTWVVFCVIVVVSIWMLVASVDQSPMTCCIRLRNIVYRESVFSPNTFIQLVEACKVLHPQLANEDGFAIGRQTVQVETGSYLHKLFYGERVMKGLGAMLGTSCLRPSPQPIEYRLYTINSRMPWHRDVMLTETCPQVEVVYTVYNTSDSFTEWIDEQNKKLERVRSKPNSMIITQGLGAFHQVTSLTRGERAIIKIAYNLIP